MLTCETCGRETPDHADSAKLSQIKFRMTLCDVCYRGATVSHRPQGNPCTEMQTASAGVHPSPSADAHYRRRFLIPELEPRIQREKNVPVMVTVLQAALDWPCDEVEALAEHLFEIATAKTEPSLRIGAMAGELAGDLDMINYLKMLSSVGDAVVVSRQHAVITDVS